MSDENIQTTTENTATSTEAPADHIPSFLDHIPEDLRSEPSLQSIKDIGSLAKGYVSAQKMIGNSVRIPGPDAAPEAKQEFYKKLGSVEGVVKLPDPGNKEEMDAFLTRLGRPSKPEDYKIDLGGLEPNQEALAEFRNLAHSIGLNSQQVDALAKYEANRANTTINQYKNQAKQTESILKEKWGTEYNNRLDAAKGLMGHMAKVYPDAVNDLVNGPAGSNPVVLSMAAELAKVYHETGTIRGNGGVKFGLTAEEATARIQEVRGNSKDAFHIPGHPEHDARVEYVRNLYTLAYPESRQA